MSAIGVDPAPESYSDSVEHRAMLARYAKSVGAAVQSMIDAPSFVNVRAYGAVGDGTTNDDDAFAAAETAAAALGVEVMIPDTGSAYVLTSQPDIHTFWGTGTISVSGTGGYVKPKPGRPDAVYYAGYGTGLLAASDESAEFQAAIDLCQTENLPLVLPPSSFIRLDSTITAYQGADTSDTTTTRDELTIIGNHAELRPNVDGPCLRVLSKADPAAGGYASGDQLGTVYIENLRFNGTLSESAAFTDTQALVFGRADYLWSSNDRSVLKNVSVNNFSGSMTAYSVQFINCRNFGIYDLSIVDNSGLEITDANSDIASFSGDMWFYGCDFRGDSNRRPVYIHGNDTAGALTANVEGINFVECFFYTGGVLLEAGNTDAIRHIYFTNPYIDTPAANERGIELLTTHSSARIDVIEIINLDATVFTGNVVRAVAAASSTLELVSIRGATIRSSADGATDTNVFHFDGVDGLDIENVRFNGITDNGSLNALVYLDDCVRPYVCGVRTLTDIPAGVDLIELSGACDDGFFDKYGASFAGAGSLLNDGSSGAHTLGDSRTF